MDNINELAAALAKAQGEMTSAKMDKTNYYGGKYATLTSIQEATRPVLSKNGLSIVQLTQQADNGVMIETVMMHSSGQSISSNWLMPPQNDVQKAGSYLSYIKRYAWASICGIAGDDDDDGEAAAGVTQPQTKKQPASKPAPKSEPKSNGDKSDPWPAKSGPVYEFCEAVKTATLPLPIECQYTSAYHLDKAIGGFGNLADKDNFDTKLSAAVDHAQAKNN